MPQREHDSPPAVGRGELERQRVQAMAWEDAGRSLLSELAAPVGARAADVGCGPVGWLRLLSSWVGDEGEAVGTDAEEVLVAAARGQCDEDGLSNVTVLHDDVFATKLEPGSFDLVHARFQLAPIGRLREQLEAFRTLVRPGGWLILEEPESLSWRLHPTAPATERLIELIVRAFKAGGGDFDVGRKLPGLLRSIGVKPSVAAHVRALPAGDPYLRMPLQLALSLEPRLHDLVSENDLATLRRQVENEMGDPKRWGTSFTLVQAWGQSPGI